MLHEKVVYVFCGHEVGSWQSNNHFVGMGDETEEILEVSFGSVKSV